MFFYTSSVRASNSWWEIWGSILLLLLLLTPLLHTHCVWVRVGAVVEVGADQHYKDTRSLASKNVVCYSNIPGLQHFKIETGKYIYVPKKKKKNATFKSFEVLSGHVIHLYP